MKTASISIINSDANDDLSGIMNIGQQYKLSGQVIAGTGTILGSLQLQVSNDVAISGQLAPFTPTNWSNFGSAVSVTTTGVQLIAAVDVCSQWLQAVYTDGFFRINSITTVADVAGSLNSKFFLISSPTVDYYVWMNINSAGVDPMVVGKTGIEVAAATGATANAVADAVASALDALAAFVAPNPAANIVACTNAVAGVSTPAADSIAAPTGFTFGFTEPTASLTVQLNEQGF